MQRYCHGGGREGVVVMGGLVQRYCHGGGREGVVVMGGGWCKGTVMVEVGRG